MGKKTAYKPRAFESAGFYIDSNGKSRVDVSASFFESMLRSAAIAKLTYKQIVLLLICKAQLYGKRKPSRDYPEQFDDDAYFYLSLKDVLAYPKMYSNAKSNADFRRDMKALVDSGFIEIAASGKGSRTKTVYRMSSKWQGLNADEPVSKERKADHEKAKTMVNDIDTVRKTPTQETQK